MQIEFMYRDFMQGDRGLGRAIFCFLTFITLLCLFSPNFAADLPAISEVDAWHEEEAHWKRIEPDLFTVEGSKKNIGETGAFTATPISLGNPLVLKLDSGAICKVTHVNGADREELKTFHRPPSSVLVWGKITSIDRESRTFTFQAVDTRFSQ